LKSTDIPAICTMLSFRRGVAGEHEHPVESAQYVPRAGHMLLVDDPDRVAPIIESFLSDTEPADAPSADRPTSRVSVAAGHEPAVPRGHPRGPPVPGR